jgi:hypothetical protein
MARPKPGIVNRFDRYDFNGREIAFADLLLVLTAHIEDAFLSAGAQAGKDYDFKTLFELANPYALSMFRTKEPVEVRIDV